MQDYWGKRRRVTERDVRLGGSEKKWILVRKVSKMVRKRK